VSATRATGPSSGSPADGAVCDGPFARDVRALSTALWILMLIGLAVAAYGIVVRDWEPDDVSVVIVALATFLVGCRQQGPFWILEWRTRGLEPVSFLRFILQHCAGYRVRPAIDRGLMISAALLIRRLLKSHIKDTGEEKSMALIRDLLDSKEAWSGGEVNVYVRFQLLTHLQKLELGQRHPGRPWSDAVGWPMQFRNVSLDGLDLRGGFFAAANFSRARLWRVDFRGADLRGSVLAGAEVQDCNFEGADLRLAESSTPDTTKAPAEKKRASAEMGPHRRVNVGAEPEEKDSTQSAEFAVIEYWSLRKRSLREKVRLWRSDPIGYLTEPAVFLMWLLALRLQM